MFSLLLLATALLVYASYGQQRLSEPSEYEGHIQPLLGVSDFGTHYYEDGAADASVVFPHDYKRPAQPVIDLVHLRSAGYRILIDCLTDRRVTTMRFDGNRITKPMSVPLGYVCLDILLQITKGKPVWEPECADDGLGACVEVGFYFRPDDYANCWETECSLRPWINVVQQNWRKTYLARQLRWHNPYDALDVKEYQDLRTQHK
jgi:hypothetical protein